MNWGRAIAIVIGLFMAFIVSMGVLMMRSNEGLDEANYYEKGLDHDAKLESIANSRSLEKPVQFNLNTEQQHLSIEFPPMALGAAVKLQLFRPDNAEMDKTNQFSIQDSSDLTQVLDIKELNRGKWMLRMSWTVSEKSYFDEYSMFLEK
jgi:hypothetical protein